MYVRSPAMIMSRLLFVSALLLLSSVPASAQSSGVKFQFKGDQKNSVACTPFDPMFASELTYVEQNGQELVYGRRGFLVAKFSATASEPKSEYQLVLGLEHFLATLDMKPTPKLIVVSHRNLGCRWLAEIP